MRWRVLAACEHSAACTARASASSARVTRTEPRAPSSSSTTADRLLGIPTGVSGSEFGESSSLLKLPSPPSALSAPRSAPSWLSVLYSANVTPQRTQSQRADARIKTRVLFFSRALSPGPSLRVPSSLYSLFPSSSPCFCFLFPPPSALASLQQRHEFLMIGLDPVVLCNLQCSAIFPPMCRGRSALSYRRRPPAAPSPPTQFYFVQQWPVA